MRQMTMKTQYKNLWDATKAGLRVKFIVTQAFFKKKKISNNLIHYLKELEKEGQNLNQQKEGDNKDQRRSK